MFSLFKIINYIEKAITNLPQENIKIQVLIFKLNECFENSVDF